MSISLSIKTLNGSVYAVNVEPAWSVTQLKQTVFEKSGIPADMMRLIAAGRILENHNTIADYNLSTGATVSLVLSLPSRTAIPASSSTGVPTPTPAPPKKNEALEKCWSAAYCEEWATASSYLESGQVSLDELQQRTGRDLLIFFGERNMVDALRFVIDKRGKPPMDSLLKAINIATKGNRGPAFDYLMSITSVAELQTVEGAVQPLHYALRFGRVVMLRFLLDNGADPNFYASTGGEGVPNHPGTPLHALAQCYVGPANMSAVEECLEIISAHPLTDINARMRDTGDNALHLVTKNSGSEKEVAIALIKLGVEVQAVNNDGKTPQQYVVNTKTDGESNPLMRVFKLVEQGKIKPNKRPAAAGGESKGDAAADEPDSKRSKATPAGPTFHTLDAQTTRLGEWTRQLEEDEEDADDSGGMRADGGKSPLTSAILTDLPALAADQSHPLQRAAQLATEIADKLEGVHLSTETDCAWFPFIVNLSETGRKKSMSLAEAIKLSIRAPKGKLSSKKVNKTSLMDLFPEEEYRQGLRTTPEEFWAFCAAALPSWTEVRFPEEAVCYPVFLCGKLELERGQSAIVGIF
eukprot:gene40781-49735_t